MSSTGPAVPLPPSIIIVKRGGDGEEGHHGGAWKIAFADFMTAMMAFFLVMWLTSVSDDATKKQIQQYFNPIKLNSSTPQTMGLDASESAPTKSTDQPGAGGATAGGSSETKALSGAAAGGTEEALFRDPYAVLAEIAADGGTGNKSDKAGVPNGTGLPGLNGGEAYRDPFDPNSWQLQPNIVKAEADTKMEPAEFAPTTVVEKTAPPDHAATAPAAPADAAAAAAAQAPKPETAKDAASADAKALQAEIKAAAPGAEGVQVSAGDGGVTISLADSVTSGMFQIGSAKPTPEAIKLVETIAKLLQERKGEIVIRGHTDARPYAGPEYDNWRLSTARAHMAYYMLARGGLDEARVDAIEGYGDRQLKDAADPFGAVNRRIEILLKEPAA